MTVVLITLNVITSLGLILFILLHAGRGGGLSDMFGGGGMGGAMAGSTVVERNLDRITVVASIIWVLTIILLGLNLEIGPSEATEVTDSGTSPSVSAPAPVPTEVTPSAPAPESPATETTAPAG